MAAFTSTRIATLGVFDFYVVTWNVTNADPTGDAFADPGWPVVGLQANGSFDGGTLTMQGSMFGAPATGGQGATLPDASEWDAITDRDGNALAFTAGAVKEMGALPSFIRPVLSGSGGSGDVNVKMLIRRTRGQFHG